MARWKNQARKMKRDKSTGEFVGLKRMFKEKKGRCRHYTKRTCDVSIKPHGGKRRCAKWGPRTCTQH